MSKRLKLEKFKAMFNCEYCSNPIVNPIALPCGESVCSEHKNEVVQSNCKFCDDKHSIEDSFPVNKVLKDMISLEICTIKLSPKYDACKEVIDEVKNNLNEIDQVRNESENFIYEYFQDIKRQVDLRREDLKLKIDDYSDELINRIDTTQKECTLLADKIKLITTDIEVSRNELNDLIDEFDSFVIDDDKYQDISKKVNDLKPKFSDILRQFKASLLNDKDYEFKFSSNPIEIEDIFGEFMSYDGLGFNKSKILTDQNETDLIRICEFSKEQKWKLIYRASEDGFGSQDFHDRCDGTIETLTIIKTTSGQIFGGYTDEAWSSSKGWIRDPNAFIFSLVYYNQSPFKAKCLRPKKAINCDGKCGPIFGRYLNISNNSNTGNDSDSFVLFSHLKNTSDMYYDIPDYEFTNMPKYFETTEIEIYRKNI